MGGGGEGGDVAAGACGTSGFGLASESGEFGVGGEEAGGKEAGGGGEVEFATQGGVVDKEDGLIFPACGVEPKGKNELARADFSESGNGDRGATG